MKKVFTILLLLAIIGWSGVINAQIPTSGLVAWYPFTGNANDSSGHGNNGTVHGATLTTDRFGNVNSAYSFISANKNYIELNSTVGKFGTSDFTISAWFNSTVATGIIICKRNTESYDNYWEFYMNRFAICQNTSPSTSSGILPSPIPSVNIWHHTVIQKTSSMLNLYIDGVLSNTLGLSTSYNITNNNPCEIGAQVAPISGVVGCFNGKIDDICIYNRALTQCEIQQLYTGNIIIAPVTAGTINGPSSVIAGSTITLTDTVIGGIWSSSNTGVATVNSSGVVSGVSLGNATITYTVSNSCGSVSTSKLIIVTSACLPTYVPTSGLVGYWPFCGNANDESGNGHNGIVNGATLATDRFGSTNSAYSFDGINDYINLGVMNSPTFSISLWARNNIIGGALASSLHTDNKKNFNIVNHGTGNGITMELGNGTGYTYLYSGQTVPVSQWHHIVALYDGTYIKIYLNGNIAGTPVLAATYVVNNENLYIGFKEATNAYFNGLIDDIGYWDRALTPCEIYQLYNGGILSAPSATNTYTYCQNETATQLTATGSNLLWYTVPTNGTGSSTAPTPSTANAGTTHYYVSQSVSGCESPRTDITILVNPKPPTPVITFNLNLFHSNAANGNQWYNQNGAINLATNQDYTPIIEGNYYVIVTLLGCSSDTSNNIFFKLTGIEQKESNGGIKLHPNPVSNELIIEADGNKTTINFEIYNSVGQLVFKGSLLNKTIVQTGSLASGVYMIKLDSGKTFELKKIIKE